MIELNGIANLKIMISNLKGAAPEQLGSELNKLDQQVDILHEYLKEVAKTMQHNYKTLEANEFGSARVVPYWHDVRDKYLKKS